MLVPFWSLTISYITLREYLGLLYLHKDSSNFIGWWQTFKTHYWLHLCDLITNDQWNITCAYTDRSIFNIDPVNSEYLPGQWWILTRSIVNIDPVIIVYWPGQYWILTRSVMYIDLVFFRYNKTIDNFPFGQHGKMKNPRPGTLGGLTWPRPTASVRSEHLEYQVSGPSFYHVDLMESY